MKQLDYAKLLETDWAEQFDNWQLNEIQLGLHMGLDVAVYAKPEYRMEQMEQIREGLKMGVDVSRYTRPEFDNAQMGEIRRGLYKGLDVSIYAKPEFDYLQMSEIRQGLGAGVDVTIYAKPEFGHKQMAEIWRGLVASLDTSAYANPEWSPDRMHVKRLTLVAEQSPNLTLITFGTYQGQKGGKFKLMSDSVDDVMRKYAGWNLAHVVPLRENGQYVAPQPDIVTLMAEHEKVYKNRITKTAQPVINRLVESQNLHSTLSELSETQLNK